MNKGGSHCYTSLRWFHRPVETMSLLQCLRTQNRPCNGPNHTQQISNVEWIVYLQCYSVGAWWGGQPPDLLTDYGSYLPILWKRSGSCTSTFSLWNMWYSACSQMGGIWLNCLATEYASYSKYKEQLVNSYTRLHRSQILTCSKMDLPLPSVHEYNF